LVENAVGSHLFNTASDGCHIQYWRESPDEIDFVLTDGHRLVAIEVKSGANRQLLKGMNAFTAKFKNTTSLVVGEGGVPLVEFFSHSAEHWLG